jgi:hypothetical protein
VTTGDPTHQVFWFASRAFGIIAMILLAVSVAAGLAMSGRLARRPGLSAKLKHFHQCSTLVTLGLNRGASPAARCNAPRDSIRYAPSVRPQRRVA